MALTHFIFVTSLVLFSSLLITSASDYGEVVKQEPGYVTNPKPGEVVKPEPGYVSKPEPGYVPKPNPGDVVKPQPGYVPKPNPGEVVKPEPGYGQLEREKEKLLSVGVQGLVLCKSGLKHYPIEGAVAKITCVGVDEEGYEKDTLSVSSFPSDEKGYFFATFSESDFDDKVKLMECKAFLESSASSENCKVPTDVNKGISGAKLSSHRLLDHKHMKLYTVGPFFFTPESKPAPNGY